MNDTETPRAGDTESDPAPPLRVSASLPLRVSSFTPSKRLDLQPGDVLLYAPSSLLGWAIALKTWERVSHVEIYAGQGESLASRDGLGVNRYPLRQDHLTAQLRPLRPLDWPNALAYFGEVRGQKYDWKGLLVFTLAVTQGAPDRQFCSEFARNFLRAGGCDCFNPDFSSDQVAPATFLTSGALYTVQPEPDAETRRHGDTERPGPDAETRRRGEVGGQWL